MGDPVPTPVLITLIDGFADRETPLIAGIGGDFHRLSAACATSGGGVPTSIGGLHVTGLPKDRPAGLRQIAAAEHRA